MPSETLTRDQASELYERLSREAAARNSRARRLRLVAKSGAGVALAAVLATGAVMAAHWPGGKSSPKYEFTPTVRTHQSSKSTLGLPYRKWEPQGLSGIAHSEAFSLSLDEARARAAFPVGAPTSDLAPESSIKAVWFLRLSKEDNDPQGTTREAVAIDYEHLEVLEEQMGSAYASAWNGLVLEDCKGASCDLAHPGAYMSVVQGLPAYVAPPNIDADNLPHPGMVVFMRGTVQIIVIGYYSDSDLLAIANSIEWAGR